MFRLTAPSADILHTSPDLIRALCQARQYDFRSRQISVWRLLLAFWRVLNGAQIDNPILF